MLLALASNSDQENNVHYSAMLVGDFIKAASFGVGETPAQPTWTIKNVVIEKLESLKTNGDEAAGKLKSKGVLYFEEISQGWVINRTNAECVAAILGPETNTWVDKKVTLYAENVSVGTKMELGIRVLGSPHLEKEISVVVKLPRRRPQTYKLIPTGPKKAVTVTPARIIELTAHGRAAALIGDNADERQQSLADWWKGLQRPEQAVMKPVLDDELKPLADKGPKPAAD